MRVTEANALTKNDDLARQEVVKFGYYEARTKEEHRYRAQLIPMILVIVAVYFIVALVVGVSSAFGWGVQLAKEVQITIFLSISSAVWKLMSILAKYLFDRK